MNEYNFYEIMCNVVEWNVQNKYYHVNFVNLKQIT